MQLTTATFHFVPVTPPITEDRGWLYEATTQSSMAPPVVDFEVVNSASGHVGTASAGQFTEMRQEATKIDRLEAVLIAYRGLDHDWDGYGGQPPNEAAVDDALAFLRLLPLGTPNPTPTLSNDGEVGFFWKRDGYYIDIGFYGDGKYSYFGEDPNGVEFGSDSELVESPLPDELEGAFFDLAAGENLAPERAA